MAHDSLLKMVAVAQSWLARDMDRLGDGSPDVSDLAACIDRAERTGIRLSNNTWRAALVCQHPTFALVTWLVARGTAATLSALRERLGENGPDIALWLCGFGVLALAADGQTLAVTAIGQRAEAAFEDLDADAASVPAGPLANTVPVQGLALAVILN